MSWNNITTQTALDKALAANKSVVFVFGAQWSAVSNETRKVFERNMKDKEYSSVYFAWIDIDDAPGMQKEHKIDAIPASFGYKNKSETTRFIGPMYTDSQVDAFIKKTL